MISSLRSGFPSFPLWRRRSQAGAAALAVVVTGLSSAHAAEVGAPACAVFGSGAAAQVHCGVVKKTSSAVTEVAWSDCPTCEAAAPSALLFPTKEAAAKSLEVARKTTVVMSELARGGAMAGFAPWVQAVVAKPADTRPEAYPRRCAADIDGDGTAERAEIATGPLPQQDTLLLTRGTAHHVLFRGALVGDYDRSKLMVKCMPDLIMLCFWGMDCFSGWTWNGKAYVESNLWDNEGP